MTANETVAASLRRVREARGWTQEQAARRISAHAQRPWSAKGYAHAERSAHGGRTRRFDADDLQALATAFDVSVSELLGSRPMRIRIADPKDLDAAAGRQRRHAAALRSIAGELESHAGSLSDAARGIRDLEAMGEFPRPAEVKS